MKNTTLLGLLSFLILSTASLPTMGQTPCVENTHFTKKVIVHDGKPYQMITFTNTSAECSWTVPAGATNIEYLVVGGGGSGGTGGSASGCGGGGAGGLGHGSFIATTNASLLIKVGVGAVAPNTSGNNSVQGTSGENSYLKGSQTSSPSPNILAYGGGGGGRHKQTGSTGGSGGGGGGRVSTAGGVATSGIGAQSNLGYSGGTAQGNDDAGRSAGGGGGGAGSAGSNGAPTSSTAGNGGIGFLSSITGENTYFAGGGGGGAIDATGAEWAGAGGIGGGGDGSVTGDATDGTDGLGGGGGGAGEFGKGGDGGDGTVIIRYNDNINLATSSAVGAGIVSEGSGLFITQGLTVDAGKTFVIDPGVKLVVEGNVVNNGTIIIKASTTDTLVYGQLKWTGTYTGTGTVQVEKKLHAGWNLLAHGMQNPTAGYFGTVADGSNTSLANLYAWGGTDFSKVFTNTTVTNNQGYLAYVGTDGVRPAAGIQVFAGRPINEYTPPALYDNTKTADAATVTMYSAAQTRTGWNLVPNPFTSDLRVGDLTRSNINASYYLRTSKGGYRAVAPAGIDPDIVPPLSAYWVQATGANPSMQRGNSGKVTLPPLAAPTVVGTSAGINMLNRASASTNSWNKAFVQMSATITNKGERYGVLERGFVYSSSDQTPTVEEITTFVEGTADTVKSGSGTGAYSKYITGLNAATTYYIRSYAKSSSGYGYGPVQTVTTPAGFTCGSNVTFTYNGQSTTYETSYHNNECWMRRNLGTSSLISGVQTSGLTAYATSGYGSYMNSHYFQWGRAADGHQVPASGISSTKSSTDAASSSSFINGYWRSSFNANLWQGVNGTNNPCPNNWRIPTNSEWTSAKSTWAVDGWGSISISDASTSMSLLLGNHRYGDGRYHDHLKTSADFSYATGGQSTNSIYWSSTVVNGAPSGFRWYKQHTYFNSSWITADYIEIGGNYSAGVGGFVRCILSDGYTSTPSNPVVID